MDSLPNISKEIADAIIYYKQFTDKTCSEIWKPTSNQEAIRLTDIWLELQKAEARAICALQIS